jgi:transcriptional regulator with XRE-family HTH domain
VRKKDKNYELAFGRNVRRLRNERDWSQGQLGSQADMSNQQISRIEAGRHAVTLHTIKVLALALGKYPDELLRFEYDLKLNTDFSPTTRKKKNPPTTNIVIKLVDGNFLNTPKSVGEIVSECERQFKMKLRSSAVSAILKKLVKSRKVKKIPSHHKKGSFQYQKK